jgi:AraC-like DNA-binding protein
MARFEDFLAAHPDQPLYLTEICAGTGVTERTLRACCEEHLGMGPIRFLTLRRMHLVRQALLRADASRTNVTRVVTDHGFWELGRFSVAYRALFGGISLGDIAARRWRCLYQTQPTVIPFGDRALRSRELAFLSVVTLMRRLSRQNQPDVRIGSRREDLN